MMEFSLEELLEFNGEGGKPAYVLHQGKVYDVTGSKLWKGGLHMRRHHAGRDLSTEITAAPHGPEMLERCPQVGVLKGEKMPGEKVSGLLPRLLSRYPMLRRHPHPMTVHFPIVFLMATAFFSLLYLITGISSFETTALHCLGAGVLFMPVVMATGLLTWWLNYMAKPLKSVNIKLSVSMILFVESLIALSWRLSRPDLLNSIQGPTWIYLLLILSFVPLVITIGWFGAMLTFPVEKA